MNGPVMNEVLISDTDAVVRACVDMLVYQDHLANARAKRDSAIRALQRQHGLPKSGQHSTAACITARLRVLGWSETEIEACGLSEGNVRVILDRGAHDADADTG